MFKLKIFYGYIHSRQYNTRYIKYVYNLYQLYLDVPGFSNSDGNSCYLNATVFCLTVIL